MTTTLLGLTSWYWATLLLRIEPMEASGSNPPALLQWQTRLYGVFPQFLGLGAIGVLGIAVWVARASEASGVVAVFAIVSEITLFVVFLAARRRWTRTATSSQVRSYKDLPRVARALVVSSVLLTLFYVQICIMSPLTAARLVSGVSMVVLITVSAICIGSWAGHWADRHRVPIIGLVLVLAVTFGRLNDYHPIRKSLSLSRLGKRSTIGETYQLWHRQLLLRYPTEDPTVFVVAAEGGGIRAAYWTAAVLGALQDQAPSFRDHVFAISGVSGGSLGASVFTGLMTQPFSVRSSVSFIDNEGRSSYRKAAQQILSYDFLSPTILALVFGDSIQQIMPGNILPDRERALETAWEASWAEHIMTPSGPSNAFARGFLETYASQQGSLLPSLFLNGTSVETGRRVIASNCLVGPQEVFDASDYFAITQSDVPFSAAIGISARFSYVSPAGTMTDRSGRVLGHVVDGGYYDNSGTRTAIDVIRAVKSQPAAVRDQIVLVVIRFEPEVTPLKPASFLGEPLDPIRTTLHAIDNEADCHTRAALAFPGVGHYVFTLRAGDVELPTTWLQGWRARNMIDLQIGPWIPESLSRRVDISTVRANVAALQEISGLLHSPPTRTDQVQRDAVKENEMARSAD
jgi:hypothetical protein